MRHSIEGDEDALLLRADKTPNSSGAQEVGVHPREGGIGFEGIIKAIHDGQIKLLYLVDDNIAGWEPNISLFTLMQRP